MSLVVITWLIFVILSVNGQTPAPVQECGQNETYNNCSRVCPMTCSMLNDRPHFCPEDVCIEGCACNRGYVRQSRTNKCVLPKDCDKY